MGVRTFYRILWTCFKRERLAAFIDGKTVAIDVSVLLHAILGDEVVSQVLQGTESIFAEVFAFLNEWFINKGMGAAKALVFVFDGDLSRPYHCDTCKAQATDRLAAKDAVAGSERAETRKLAAAQFDEILLAANKAVHDGVLVDEKLLALKRAELDALAKKSLSRSTCVRTAMLFWIVQHNNHLFRDADGLGGVAAGKDDKKARVQRPTKEEKRRGNTYDVKRKHYKRCPITIFLSRGEADDSLGALSQQNIVDIVATTDADAIAWACSVMILKGVFDRRKQETHLVSVVTEQAVLEHIRNVLINVDDPRQSWRLQDKFDEWRQQQQDLVGPKGKSKKKATTTAAAAAEVAAAAAAALERVKATWPEDIVLLQAQPVRLSLVVGFRAFGRGLLTKRANDIEDDASSDGTDEEEEEENDEEQEQDEEEQEEGVGEDAQQDEGEGGGGGAAGARPRSRRPRRRTIDPSGAKSLTKKEVDADLAEYLSGELGRLMLRRHNGVLRRYHASPMDPTLNTNLNNYRPSACEQ